MPFSMTGKTTIVTGAAAGIGLAIARRFAEADANVMMVDSDDQALRRECRDMPAGSNAQRYCGDINEKLTIVNLLAATLDAYERVDVLVNANLRWRHSDPMVSHDDALDELFRHNVLANMRLTRLVADRMIQQAQDEGSDRTAGAIVNISALVPENAPPELFAFSISCAALNRMTQSFASALARHRIRVNAVAAGGVLATSLRRRPSAATQQRESADRAGPLDHIAETADIAETAQFLAATGALAVTGEIMTIDSTYGSERRLP